jgi:hypothetical protein
MLRHRHGVIEDKVRKIIEIHADRSHVAPRSVEGRAMALSAAHIDQVHLSGGAPAGTSTRHFPGCGTFGSEAK